VRFGPRHIHLVYWECLATLAGELTGPESDIKWSNKNSRSDICAMEHGRTGEKRRRLKMSRRIQRKESNYRKSRLNVGNLSVISLIEWRASWLLISSYRPPACMWWWNIVGIVVFGCRPRGFNGQSRPWTRSDDNNKNSCRTELPPRRWSDWPD
jgi:hypothetical protein